MQFNYPLSSATLPAECTIPPQNLKLLDDFFTIVDTPDPENGKQLARDVFLPDGIFNAPFGQYHGASEISTSRKGAWDSINWMRHEVSEMYQQDAAGKKVMLYGRIIGNWKETGEQTISFAARMEIGDGDGEKPKMKFFQGWIQH